MTNAVADIRDIKGLVPVPLAWGWIALIVVVLVLVGVIVWWSRRKKPVATGETPVQRTPAELALAALATLKEQNLPVEVFYTRVSDIIRQFIEGQFGLHAPERTTEEFLVEAKLPAESMTLLGAFLQECDLVKFARHRPGKEDRERAFGAAEKFVREGVGQASRLSPETAETGRMPVQQV